MIPSVTEDTGSVCGEGKESNVSVCEEKGRDGMTLFSFVCVCGCVMCECGRS